MLRLNLFNVSNWWDSWKTKKCLDFSEIGLSRGFLSSTHTTAKTVFEVSSKSTYADDLDVLYHNKSLSLHRVCLKYWLENVLQILRNKNLTISSWSRIYSRSLEADK